MTFAEVHAAVRELAMRKGKNFAVDVESSESRSGEMTLQWQVYISAYGWTEDYLDPADALAEMRARIDGTWGNPKPASQADLDAVGNPAEVG